MYSFFSLFNGVNITEYIEACKGKALSIIVCALLLAVVELAVAGSVSFLGLSLTNSIDAIRGTLAKILPYSVFFEFVTQSGNHVIAFALIMLVFLVVIKNFMMFLLTKQTAHFSFSVAELAAIKIFTSYLSRPYVWHLTQSPSKLQTILGWRISVAHYCTGIITFAIQIVIMGFLILASLIAMGRPAWIMFGITGIVTVLCYSFLRRKIDNESRKAKDMDMEQQQLSLSVLQGIQDVIISKKQGYFRRRYLKQHNALASHQASLAVFPPMPSWLIESTGILSLALMFTVFWGAGMSHLAITSQLALMAGVAWRIFPCMGKLSTALYTMRSCRLQAQQVLNQTGVVTEADFHAIDPAMIPQFSSHITLENISFAYPGSGQEVLKDVSLSVPKGQVIGIVGKSGAGKSTLIGILTGLLRPTRGKLLVDDNVITEEMAGAWLEHIGYVPQSPHLFDTSLIENIAFTSSDAEIDEARILSSCKLAAVDFVDTLEEGLMTRIGERGGRLSGGQAQRVAIARALYSSPSLLIFDEATTALDPESEESIVATIRKLKGKYTVVVIAHRDTALQACDAIYRIEEGRLSLQRELDGLFC